MTMRTITLTLLCAISTSPIFSMQRAQNTIGQNLLYRINQHRTRVAQWGAGAVGCGTLMHEPERLRSDSNSTNVRYGILGTQICFAAGMMACLLKAGIHYNKASVLKDCFLKQIAHPQAIKEIKHYNQWCAAANLLPRSAVTQLNTVDQDDFEKAFEQQCTLHPQYVNARKTQQAFSQALNGRNALTHILYEHRK